MPAFFSKVFRGRDGAGASSLPASSVSDEASHTPSKSQWKDAWLRTQVEPEEVQRLLHGCTLEVKSRGLTLPFLLLPFRPSSDAGAAKMFVRNYFGSLAGTGTYLSEEDLQRELRLTNPMVLCSVLKWCWSRLPGGVVTWEAYELFRIGEQGSNMARDSFATFLPLSVDSDARLKIIFDFFDLMAAIAAYGKNNGFGGRKLSRLAGWWAFDHSDQGDGFEGGYRSWARAADATSHLFFAYLRSLSQAAPGTESILTLPRSLQALLQATEYPPQTPVLLQHTTAKLVMIVDTVSPTPFALLRRAKQFEFRDDDRALLAFAAFEDPVQALTEECRRVLNCISSTNQSASSTSKTCNGTQEAAWSRFEDMGFSGLMEEPEDVNQTPFCQQASLGGLNSSVQSGAEDVGRPTTPSWADFLSAGFDQSIGKGRTPYLLPPDKVLPPIETSRAKTLQSLRNDDEASLEPGELASITVIYLDDSFWWVWITSLAGEEPPERKAVFGRCAVIETDIPGGQWLVVEEKVKGAAPEPEEGAHLVVKKSRFGLTRRGRGISWRGRSAGSKNPPPSPESPYGGDRTTPVTKSHTSTSLNQHARIQAAAAALQQKQRNQRGDEQAATMRRTRTEEVLSTKTSSVFTLQPMFLSEAAPALKWAHKFDKESLREAYLATNVVGKGQSDATPHANGEIGANGVLKKDDSNLLSEDATKERNLPALPRGGELPRPPPVSAVSDGAAYQTTASAPQAAQSQPTKAADMQTKELSSSIDNKPPPQAQPAEQPTTGYFSPAATMSEETSMKESRAESPVEEKKTGKKLHRLAAGGGGGGGFKKFFGMKNADRQPSQTPPVGQTARDVQESKHPGPGRRFSSFRGKSSPMIQRSTTEPTPEEPTEDMHVNPAASADSLILISGAQAAETPEMKTPAPEGSTGTSTTGDPAAPEHQTSFHHGPLEDVPEFVPADSPEDGSSDNPVSPITVEDPEPQMNGDDNVSEQSLELLPGPSPAVDRWAQIRKNAAERVAAKASESQTRLSQTGRTDDGETSGEETIESRVARIKARVAELTGNLDESNTLRASQR